MRIITGRLCTWIAVITVVSGCSEYDERFDGRTNAGIASGRSDGPSSASEEPGDENVLGELAITEAEYTGNFGPVFGIAADVDAEDLSYVNTPLFTRILFVDQRNEESHSMVIVQLPFDLGEGLDRPETIDVGTAITACSDFSEDLYHWEDAAPPFDLSWTQLPSSGGGRWRVQFGTIFADGSNVEGSFVAELR